MKNKILIVIFMLVVFGVLAGCNQLNVSNDYLRIHIRANSNAEDDQIIKYEIKDLVIEHLTPFLAECKDKNSVINMLGNKKYDLEGIIDNFLKANNFSYKSNVVIDNQFFPTRYYGEYLFPSDYYDAIIINLGQAKGDNWWCVVYPPLCFAGGENSVIYKSKIKEIISAFFK